MFEKRNLFQIISKRFHLIFNCVKSKIACRDGDGFPLEEQYFKDTRRGKSQRKCEADFRKIFGQKSRYLALLWSELAEKLPK